MTLVLEYIMEELAASGKWNVPGHILFHNVMDHWPPIFTATPPVYLYTSALNYFGMFVMTLQKLAPVS